VLSQIVSHTPTWVFVLLAVLIALGVSQTRTRTVPRARALILPAAMILLSLAGIQSSFGLGLLPVACWGAALAAVTVIGVRWFRDDRVSYDAATARFQLPGSWMPLVVILAIFFAKYAFAVLRGFNAEVLTNAGFVAAVAAIFGLLSGYFAARAANLLRLLA
jgi:hypothetical protein